MYTEEIERHFAAIEQFNQSNATEAGLCLEDYLHLNNGRLKNLNVLESLFKEMQNTDVMVPKDKMHELAVLLRDSFTFAINNRMFTEADRIFSLINLHDNLFQRLN